MLESDSQRFHCASYPMKPYLAKVTWYDTVDSSSWDTASEVNVQKVEQWGYVISKDKLQVKLADTYSNDDWYGVTAIPTKTILTIEKLYASSSHPKRKTEIVSMGRLRQIVSEPIQGGRTG